MAKWKLETGEIIESSGNYYTHSDNKMYHTLMFRLNDKICNIYSYAPSQQVGAESDFIILPNTGKTIKATLIKEPQDLMEYWQQNEVEGFRLSDRLVSCYVLSNSKNLLAYIPKSWSLERQIDALNKLIEIYKD